ncbi:MAG: hypothetical protein KJO98_16985 [Rhodothermia bacterium]|nr:hypothetical protein [Rhodothermia bacterium]
MTFLDAYTLQARVIPGFLAALPIWLTLVATAPELQTMIGGILITLGAAGVPLLTAQIVRDRGKQCEAELFDSWGGAPTTVALRHRRAEDLGIVELLHNRLSKIHTETPLPSEAEEWGDPRSADRVYAQAVLTLRERTRDKSRFPLVIAANITYGFRRNLLGIRPLGCVVAAVAVAALLAAAFMNPGSTGVLNGILFVVQLALLVFWVRVVSASWVRVAAEEYRDRLFGAMAELVA